MINLKNVLLSGIIIFHIILLTGFGWEFPYKGFNAFFMISSIFCCVMNLYIPNTFFNKIKKTENLLDHQKMTTEFLSEIQSLKVSLSSISTESHDETNFYKFATYTLFYFCFLNINIVNSIILILLLLNHCYMVYKAKKIMYNNKFIEKSMIVEL